MEICIDNGGTFTDVCVIGGAQLVHTKTLTTPDDLTRCFFDVLEEASARLYGAGDVSRLLRETDRIRYSTTAGTNAMVELNGPRLGLIVRQGWAKAVLSNSSIEAETLEVLVGSRIGEVDASPEAMDRTLASAVTELGRAGATYLVVSLDGPTAAEDEARLKRAMLRLFPRHLVGATPVLYSHELVDEPDDRLRTWTALIDAFLHPTMEHFLYNAERELRRRGARRPLLVFGNDGSSTRVAKTTAVKTFSSGPRGGLGAAAALAARYGLPRVLTMDIGGTSTDVALVEGSRVPERDPGDIVGVPVSLRLGDVHSAGLGGSSVFTVVEGNIQVGPRSVGAVPGPACFGRGGTSATITDAFLLSGVLDASSYFGGRLQLDPARAKAAIQANVASPLGLGLEEALIAMEAAYDKAIASAILGRATASSRTTLMAFGGAGPMSACGIAEAAGIADVIVPRLAAVLSAFGISFSDIQHSYRARLAAGTPIAEKLAALRAQAQRDMYAEGFSIEECTVDAWVRGSNGEGARIGANSAPAAAEASGFLELTVTKPIAHFEFLQDAETSQDGKVAGETTRSVLEASGRRAPVGVVSLERLKPGAAGEGPLIIEDDYFACRVGTGWRFEITANRDIRMRRD